MRAATWGRPYGVSSTRNVCSAKPGAKAEPHQRQFLQTQGPVARREGGGRLIAAPTAMATRPRWFGNPGAKAEPHQRQFLQTQGPVARRELRKATQILRAGRALPTQRDNPRKRGPGKAVLWARSAHRPRPRWRFGYFAAMGKVTRRPQAAKLPAKWRAGSSRPTPGKGCFFIAPSSAPFGGTFPYPFCRCATSPLDKGSRPPGGRLFRRIFVSIRITNVSDEDLTGEVEDCLEFTLNFVQTQGANLTKMSGYFLVKCTFLSVFCVVQ